MPLFTYGLQLYTIRCDVFQDLDVNKWLGYRTFLKISCNNYAKDCTTEDANLIETYAFCALDLIYGHYRMLSNKCVMLRSNCREYGCKYAGIYLVKFNSMDKMDECPSM